MEREEKKLIVRDIYLAAFLELNNIHSEIKIIDGWAVFYFPASDNTYKITNGFNSNQVAPVAEYVATLRKLKSKMLISKRESF